MTTQICKECGLEKDLILFMKDKRYKLGVRATCQTCRNKYSAEWCKKNPEKRKQSSQAYIKNNPIKRKESSKNYYQKIKNNPEIKAKRKECLVRWKKTFRGKLIRRILEQKRRKYIKDTDDKTINYNSVCELLEKQKWCCAITGKDLSDGFHIDHKIPLSLGGRHTISNIQLVLPIENLKKGVKIGA